jgi:1,4-dihydroxy-2-naphthoate octaprenyltransferase
VHLIRHFRLPFSFLLLPVFLLALATAECIRGVPTLLAFVILHMLVYPSSNAYNSLQDRDTGPIGGIEHPEAVPPVVGPLTLGIDLLAIGLSALVSPVFMGCIALYIVLSRLYSFRGVRLKKHPVLGYLTVVISQGALIYFAVYQAISGGNNVPVAGVIVSTLLLGAFYPVTQIYQHEQDQQDQVRTISATLGVRGTFIYCAVLYGAAFSMLGNWFYASGRLLHFGILLLALSPVLVWFMRWAIQCFRNPALADYRHTMQMSWRAAGCTNIAFFLLAILPHRFG